MFFTSRQLNEINTERLQKLAPAVFAQNPHERTSDRYLFIPTLQIVQELTKEGWAVVSAVQQRSRTQSKETGKHALMLVRRDLLGSQYNAGDVMPLLKIENSHNGLSSFCLQAGLFRKACANGLTVPDTLFLSPKVRHTTGINKETVEASFRILQDYPQLMGRVDALRSVSLNDDERMILAASASRIVFEEDQIERTAQVYRQESAVAQQLLAPKRYEDKKTDLWTTINVIQENAIRGNVKIVGETGKIKSAKQVQNIDRDSKINKELLTLAAKMAELKGVKVA